MLFVLLHLLVGSAMAALCALDADGDRYAGQDLEPDGDGDCDDLGEFPADRLGEDCDDADASIYPGAPEVLGDLVDQDCNMLEDCFADVDHDGWRTEAQDPGWGVDADCEDIGEARADQPSGDCNDGSPETHPEATELVADDVDEDCDGHEACYPDADLDDFRTNESIQSEDTDCDDPGEAHFDVKLDDCDDNDPDVHADCAPVEGALTGSDCGSGSAVLFAAGALFAARPRPKRRPC